jgi:predicted anti-sigma-YlaC factor YlaD
VTCEQVRDQLAEYLLGDLNDVQEQAIARHLRGCGGCRTELASLGEGINTFARAAHELDPPEELKERVTGALREEWKSAGRSAPERRRLGVLAWAAAFLAVVVFSGSIAAAVVANGRAAALQAEAGKYHDFLATLGGENVRVGSLSPSGTQEVHGSVVMYDSSGDQSWVLVLVHAPGLQGQAHVTLHGGSHEIDLRPLVLDSGGEGSTWLVTGADLTEFSSVSLQQQGSVLATGTVSRS